MEGLNWAYIQSGLRTEGNLRFKSDWASLILRRKFTVFLCFTLYLRAISKYNPTAPAPLIFGKAYFRNFSVSFSIMTAWLGVTDIRCGSTPVSTILRKSVRFFITNIFLIKKTFRVKVMLHETIRNDDF